MGFDDVNAVRLVAVILVRLGLQTAILISELLCMAL